MRPALVIGGIAIAGLALAAVTYESGTPDEKVSGLPRTKRLVFRLPSQNETGHLRIGPGVVLLDGHSVPTNATVEIYRQVATEFQNAMAERKKSLPANASPVNTDANSKELYWGPSWLLMRQASQLSANDVKQMVNGVPFDEFGRLAPGNYGHDSQDLWNQTFGGLLKNPLFKTVVVAALVASGPEGMAIYGAYSMWEARGKDWSLKNAALTAGRAYAVSQCGTPCGVAFDFGVGVASGKSYDKAAEDALVSEMTPEQRAMYTQGKNSAHKMGLV